MSCRQGFWIQRFLDTTGGFKNNRSSDPGTGPFFRGGQRMSESSVESHPRGVPLAHRLEQLDRQISRTVERVVHELHQEIGERVRRGSQEMLRMVEGATADIPSSFLATQDLDLSAWTEETGAAAGERALADLLSAIARLDAETSQADIL